MRIELRLSLRITRDEKPDEPHETFESQGSLVETREQPNYVGFEATQ